MLWPLWLVGWDDDVGVSSGRMGRWIVEDAPGAGEEERFRTALKKSSCVFGPSDSAEEQNVR